MGPGIQIEPESAGAVKGKRMGNIPNLGENEWLRLMERLTRHADCKLPHLYWRGVRGSRGMAPIRGMGADDIAAEAITDVIEGRRAWDQGAEPDFLKFLKSVVDSKVSHLVRTVENRKTRRLGPPNADDETSTTYQMVSSDPDPADVVADNDEALEFQKSVIKALQGDEFAYRVMECLEAELTPSEIAEYLGEPISEVNNAQKRLRRKVEKVQDTHRKGGRNV